MKNLEELRNEYEKVELIVKKLKKTVHSSLVNDISFNRDFIAIQFLDNCYINIINKDSYRKVSYHESNQIMIFDENYDKLKSMLDNKPISIKDGFYWFGRLLSFITKRETIKKDDYFLLPNGSFKKSFYDKYGCYNPEREIELLSNDEIRYRYFRNREMIDFSNKKEYKVELFCNHSFLFENEESIFIDCDNSGVFNKEGKIIIDRSKIIYDDKEKSYKLRDGVKEEDCISYSIENIKRKKAIFYQEKGLFYLRYKNRNVRISHPDLNLYLLD